MPFSSRLFFILCFNPLPHAEGDLFQEFLLDRMNSFNPLPHAEGDFWPGV